jgi:hypothetical protein
VGHGDDPPSNSQVGKEVGTETTLLLATMDGEEAERHKSTSMNHSVQQSSGLSKRNSAGVKEYEVGCLPSLRQAPSGWRFISKEG